MSCSTNALFGCLARELTGLVLQGRPKAGEARPAPPRPETRFLGLLQAPCSAHLVSDRAPRLKACPGLPRQPLLGRGGEGGAEQAPPTHPRPASQAAHSADWFSPSAVFSPCSSSPQPPLTHTATSCFAAPRPPLAVAARTQQATQRSHPASVALADHGLPGFQLQPEGSGKQRPLPS